MTLREWGWDEGRCREWAGVFEGEAPRGSREFAGGRRPGRVIRPGRGIHRIAAESGGEVVEREARLTGRALGRGEAPAAGDWVTWREEGGTVLIDSILPRRTAVSRNAPGDASREQVIAANIDTLFVVQALGRGRGFTPRGLERYITMAWESGCRPAVILSKADLSADPDADRLEAEASAPGVDVVVCSVLDESAGSEASGGMGESEAFGGPGKSSGSEASREAGGFGIGGVRALLAPGETGAFVGPSGSGKTSLLNALAGAEIARTGGVRETDARGRHTTTHRELHRLSDGRLILDTPGLRELQPWGEAGSADAAFPEIEQAAAECRFRDCRHENEPGCGVRLALEEGLIEPERFESWLELRRELAWLETRRDEKARQEVNRKWKDITRMARQARSGKKVW